MEVLIPYKRRLTISDHGLTRGIEPLTSICRVSFACAVIVSLISGCFGKGLPLERSYQFREQLPVGTPRDEVVAILSEDAWYHEICKDHPFNAEIFFYDNREWDRAEIVIMFTELYGDEYVLEGIYGAEPNEWHTWYDGCYDRSMFIE